MNKQEAIEYFKNKEKGYLIKPSQINVSTTEVIHIIKQIDEPKKQSFHSLLRIGSRKIKAILTHYIMHILCSAKEKTMCLCG